MNKSNKNQRKAPKAKREPSAFDVARAAVASALKGLVQEGRKASRLAARAARTNGKSERVDKRAAKAAALLQKVRDAWKAERAAHRATRKELSQARRTSKRAVRLASALQSMAAESVAPAAPAAK